MRIESRLHSIFQKKEKHQGKRENGGPEKYFGDTGYMEYFAEKLVESDKDENQSEKTRDKEKEADSRNLNKIPNLIPC